MAQCHPATETSASAGRSTVGIVLLVSLAHALVHTYELIFPAVEQPLAQAWSLGPSITGRIATAWALPYGLGALGAGWLADRFGSRAVLILYLLGGSAACVVVWQASHLPVLMLSMFAMGSFASLYHPAGLAYISRQVPTRQLGLSLGYHGIVGSLGIAGAPLLGGLLLLRLEWNEVYLALAPIGLGLALLLAVALPDDAPRHEDSQGAAVEMSDWRGFALICSVTLCCGFVYRGFITFLPRYLSEVGFSETAAPVLAKYLTAGVLVLGMIGHLAGGWLCGRWRLETLLLGALLANIPFLLWMGGATGSGRILATGGFAIVHFLLQPVTNSLIARYTSSHRRSLGYGINFLIAFGMGSFGATLAGEIADRWGTESIYPVLAAVVALAAGAAVIIRQRPSPSSHWAEPDP